MSDLFDQTETPPDFRLEFRVVPSWNDFLTSISNPFVQAQNVKLWRQRGRDRAVEKFRELGMPLIGIRRELRSVDKKTGDRKSEFFEGLAEPFFDEPIACLVRLWRPTAAAYDIHNLVVKPLFDGLVDVKLLSTDSVGSFPEMGYRFEGVDTTLKLTAAETAERKAYLDSFRDRNKTPPRLPLPARIWFDFTRISELPNRSIFAR